MLLHCQIKFGKKKLRQYTKNPRAHNTRYKDWTRLILKSLNLLARGRKILSLQKIYMRKFATLFTSCIILLLSCAKENSTQPTISESEIIPLEEALGTMTELIGSLGILTKSIPPIYSVEVFGGLASKAQEIFLPDTSLYIVNFSDDRGYAVLAAQRRISTKVFCITESGVLSASDIYDAIEAMDNTFIQSKSTASNEESWTDFGQKTIPCLIASSMINQISNDCTADMEFLETKTTTYTGLPDTTAMLETKWGQMTPFNDFRTDHAPAGCVAIATAQIIEFNALHHGYTTFVEDNNVSFDWPLLKTVYNKSNPYYAGSISAQNEASSFSQYIGLSKNCNISYDIDGSGGYADGAKRTFKNMGYSSVKKYFGFENADKNRAIAQLTSGFPMYMDGSRSGGGHAWVLDGVFVRKVYEDGEYDRTENMFHINWGWNGDGDGYFIQGIFDTTQRITYESGVDSGNPAVSRNYTWNYRTITYSL